MREKGFAHILVLILLLAGLVAGVYLVTSGNPLKLFSRATGIKDSKDPKIGATKVVPLESNTYTGTSYLQTASMNTDEDSIFQQTWLKTQLSKQKGYIIELQSKPVAEAVIEKGKTGVSIAGTQGEVDYRKQLEQEHKLAKEDILAKVKSKVKIGTASTEKEIKVLSEFFSVLNGLAIEASPAQIESIKTSVYVKRVSPNLEVKPFLNESITVIEAPSVWDMTDNTGQKITGKGVKIGIIDSGIDYQHPDLGGCFGEGCKVLDGYDFANDDNDPMDDAGHGTHVASIAAGNGTLKGVAPEANLVAYKVLDSDGRGYADDIIAALDRSVDPNQDGRSDDHLDVVNLSLGANCWGAYSAYCGPDDPIAASVNRVVWRGIVVVAAAGNSGPNERTIGSPAVAYNAVAVGASSKSDQIAQFSSRGPVVVNWGGTFWSYIKPDVVAPGVNICAAKASSLNVSSTCGDSNHASFSGTSMAAPHVAGAAALIKQAYPDLPSTSYKNILQSSANLVIPNPLFVGGGRLNLPAAINQASGNPSRVDLDVIALNGQIRNITGLISSQDLKGWNLSYSPIEASASANWTQLQQSTTIPLPNLRYSLDVGSVPNGIFKVRLQSEDNDGRKSRVYGYLEVVKYKIKTPQNSDIYRVGDQVFVDIETEEGVIPQSIQVEYAKEGASYSQMYNGNEKSFTWNTSGLDSGLYRLKFTIEIEGTSSQQEVQLYLDSSLKAGWPKRLNYEMNPVENSLDWIGELDTSVDDLDGDGTSEIIFQTAGFPPKLWVYNSDGTVRWSKELRPANSNNSSNLDMVLVDDLNGDGKKEILLQNFMFEDTEIQAYDYQGNNVPGWPVKIRSHSMRLSSADLDNDGSREIIARIFSFDDKLIILSKSGQIINQWLLPSDNLSAQIESAPAFGNFDNDSDLEIVVATPSTRAAEFPNGIGNEGHLNVYNSDGTMVQGWPATFPGLVTASPVVGDLDRDGLEEIVLGIEYYSEIFPDLNYGGLYVYNRKGQLLPGWPKGRGYNYWSTPALADLDKDGYLEIIASRLGEQTEVYKYNGSMFPGWPQSTNLYPTTPDNNYYSDIAADINGDGQLEVISRTLFGIFAWNKRGESISGFPKILQRGENPPTIKDIDNDGKAEIVSSAHNDIDLIKLKNKARGAIYVWEMPTNSKSGLISWPTFKQNEFRTGRYPLISPPPSPPPGRVGRACVQVITPARKESTGECRDFPTPCDVPPGWVKVSSCGVSDDISSPSPSPFSKLTPGGRVTPSVSCTACLADVNKDKNVNISDISLWSYCRVRGINSSSKCLNADLDKDGKAGDTDLRCITSQFGKKCNDNI